MASIRVASRRNGASRPRALPWRAPWSRSPVEVFARREVIWTSTDKPAAIYRVVSGRVRLMVSRPNSAPALRALLGPGGVFGTRTAAGGPVQVAIAEGAAVWSSLEDDVEALCTSDPLAAAEVAWLLGQSIEGERRRIALLTSANIPPLICRTLIDLAQAHGVPCAHGGTADLHKVTQSDLGDMVGASRPFVSTYLNALKRRRVLGATSRGVCILDAERLQALARPNSSGPPG